MSINMSALIKDYFSGMNIKQLAAKYKMSEKELNAAIDKELHTVTDYKQIRQQQLAKHNQKVDEQYNLAYQKLQSGEYMEALKLGLSATIDLFNQPQDPNLTTGIAPCPMKWADVKSLFSLIKSLKNLPQVLSNLKNCKTVQQFKGFITKIAQDLKFVKKPKTTSKSNVSKNPNLTHAKLVTEYSKGKNLIDMTDEELIVYYKKLIPDIDKKELKCLIDQMHRIKKGEPRWLNTEEEMDILRSIRNKMEKHETSLGVTRLKREPGKPMKRCAYDEEVNKPADIPFKKKELTDYQEYQLRAWYDKGADSCIEPIFDELGTVLDHDVYLYRCVTIRADNSLAGQKNNCDFLNTIKPGSIIDNGSHYNSTASNINNTLDYSTTFGHSYILKIKVPKGTKVLDMRRMKDKATEVVMPPCSYKVNKIDYTTGIVDCDFIPH